MPRTLILEPTRELAAQVEEAFGKYGVNHKLNLALLIGGVSFGDQETKIARGADVVIATPGRLLDFTERGGLLLTRSKSWSSTKPIACSTWASSRTSSASELVPFTRQTLFFSATMPPEITRLADAFLQNPVRVEVSRPPRPPRISPRRSCRPAERRKKSARPCAVSFAAPRIQERAHLLQPQARCAGRYRSLQKHGFSVLALHGDLDQRMRTAALDAFRAGEVQLLVCSDVAARGLDIPDVSHVINYDAPHHSEDYVHRMAGLAARASRAKR